MHRNGRPASNGRESAAIAAFARIGLFCKVEMEQDLLSFDACDANLDTRNGKRLDRQVIESRLSLCPALPSLGSINKALQDLLSAEQRLSTQISEVSGVTRA